MKFWLKFLVLILALVGLSTLIKSVVDNYRGEGHAAVAGQNSILHLDLKGVILNGEQFLKNLKDYREDKAIKAIIINVNSPGGAVGPSQEIYSELIKTRNEFSKPIVCFSSGLMASGGYYVALGCDQIVVAPGALLGSIGVIMNFANLEKLYDWAKVSRYSITSGKFKDSGAEYRSMRDDEKKLFQDMIDEVYDQFRTTVKDSRKEITPEVLSEYTDGRVFTGNKAVALKFADQVGTYDDAVQIAAQIAGLKKGDFEIFKIPKRTRSLWDLGEEREDDTINGHLKSVLSEVVPSALGLNLNNQPLFLMPGTWLEKNE
ncbi:MAG: signal peptide peptidase SppA [Bdellovibrionales bacterium]